MSEARENYERSKQEQWKALVIIAASRGTRDMREFLDSSGAERTSLKRKIAAITWCNAHAGMPFEEIVQFGQNKTLSHYAAAKKNGHNEKRRHLRWLVSKGLADAVERDVVARIARVLEIETSEEFWLFLHSVFLDTTDAQLRHAAGMPRLKKK